jgi:hypothetical protein
MSALPESPLPVSPELALVDPELARAERRRRTEAPARPARSPRPPTALTPASRPSRHGRSDPILARTAAPGGLGSVAAAVVFALSLFVNGLLASVVLTDRHRARSPVVVTTTVTTYDTGVARPTPFEGPELPPPPGAESGPARPSAAG